MAPAALYLKPALLAYAAEWFRVQLPFPHHQGVLLDFTSPIVVSSRTRGERAGKWFVPWLVTSELPWRSVPLSYRNLVFAGYLSVSSSDCELLWGRAVFQ